MELGRFKTLKPKILTKAKPVMCHICDQDGHFASGRATKHKANKNYEIADKKPTQSMLTTLSINNMSSYTLSCEVFGTPVSFLIDTVAGVCLLRQEVWDRK